MDKKHRWFLLDSGGGGFDADYKAILTEATSQGYTLPSSDVQALQNEYLRLLKSIGVWSLLDEYYCFNSDGDSDFTRINWKNPSERCNISGTVNWTSGAGWKVPSGSAASSGIIFAKNLLTDSINYTNLNCACGCYIDDYADSTPPGDIMGAGISPNRDLISTFPFSVLHPSPENNPVNIQPAGANRNHLLERNGNTVKYWYNGVLRQTKTQTIGSGTPPNDKLSLFRNLGQGLIDNTTVAMAWSGGSMDGLEEDFDSAWQGFFLT